ncbi:YggS family pyridoxal phosphate-dependent enzyme [Gordonia jinhuaensis]|uniref:Pyridoxal phosphate homeostasis protein n=1 Tax=Gordonia jinhuaensis TaxID=1517702 RepID=A0A916WQ81_9ACTN|nr:alanine racemase [Gordonia jinhuaensis]GGB19345.1 YggS family pyridoxal phosphate enzyme [Gordonia jinhuaensis]
MTGDEVPHRDSAAPGPGDARTVQLRDNLAAAHARLERACRDADRDPAEVELLVVTKFFPADDVSRLIGLGAHAFGESREPEAGRKVAAVRAALHLDNPDTDSPTGGVTDTAPVFDMIGTLQRNKAKSVAQWARRVHSVDSARLADALDTAAASALDSGARSAVLDVLLQVSLDGDISRGGALIEDLPSLADAVDEADALALRGLMVIAPLRVDADEAMANAAQVRERFLADHPGATVFSAGMSGDLEAAVRHGSTCVRVGTAIMGSRPIRSP